MTVSEDLRTVRGMIGDLDRMAKTASGESLRLINLRADVLRRLVALVERYNGQKPPAPPPTEPEPQTAANRTEAARNRAPIARPADMPARTIPERPTREVDGVVQLRCPGTDRHPAHWAPETEFLVRTDRPHSRVSLCHEGRKTYQRARRVSLKTLEALSSAGIQLTLDEGSNLVGIVCKDCGQPFAAGDQVEGEATMRHQTCPEEMAK